ncbi:hypothetical protein CTEN210_06345 [Chaetoceros tenuissimus]|uniref:Calpain catalytic domain-containing protein n=1 Tax=Chaetoceros tenuissimus TaxID=426638 RepID=A0AAD3CQB3_9STRA|nr:hypothetical protein CTEN210_06345 [Chaetoceros tenuissimus]
MNISYNRENNNLHSILVRIAYERQMRDGSNNVTSEGKEIIVIDDDDSCSFAEQEVEVIALDTEDHSTKDPRHVTKEASININVNQNDIVLFQEITGVDESTAIDAIRNSSNNVQQAIASFFDSSSSSADILVSSTSKCSQNNKNQNISDEKDRKIASDYKCIDDKKRPSAKQEKQVLISCKPTKKWDKAIEACRALQVKFVDQDFPPNTSSLDGRKILSKTDADDDKVIKCNCGVAAAVKTVQRDGPNYGRFFLSCGRPRPKRKVNNVPIVLDNGGNTKNQKSDGATYATKNSQCRFFQWDDKHQQSSQISKQSTNAWVHLLQWVRFESFPTFKLNHQGRFYPSDVKQGAMGDCWFLSALAVVAERQYLMEKIFPHQTFNEEGCYEVNFCLDGKWSPILVDSCIPAIAMDASKKRKRSTSGKNENGSVEIQPGIAAQPAFASGTTLWPCLVEKAYAKVHGSYSRLSGGFISEAFADLTGSPVERIRFRQVYDLDSLFARILSFTSAGFLMGIATNAGGNGLVPCHAYSLLNVYEVHGVVVGQQKKVTNFFTKEEKHDDEITIVDTPNDTTSDKERTVRLVRIRNPWGTKEWQGKWAASSEEWTEKLRKQIGETAYKKGDGTFFMEFSEMIQRFDHMDVAKCQEGWYRIDKAASLKLHNSGDPLYSSNLVYHCNALEGTWAFVSIVQQKKRSNATTQFWYTDLNLIVMKRKRGVLEWVFEKCLLQGVDRTCDCEMFFESCHEYCLLPFSYLSGRGEVEFGAQLETRKTAPFQFVIYSAKSVSLKAEVRSTLGSSIPLRSLQLSLLTTTEKVVVAVGPSIALVTTSKTGCVYFMLLNGNMKHSLIFNLVVELPHGINTAYGKNQDTYIIPPMMQAILLVLTNDGRNFSSTINFSHKSDGANESEQKKQSYNSIHTKAALSVIGKSICEQIDISKPISSKGNGTIDSRLWSA